MPRDRDPTHRPGVTDAGAAPRADRLAAFAAELVDLHDGRVALS